MSMQASASPISTDSSSLEVLDALRRVGGSVFRGRSELVDHLLVAVLAGGHVLLEDVPGVGKTTLAEAVAGALGCRFVRIQFTADLLPSDILGVSIFDAKTDSFVFHPGPLFANIVLADEINRTPPKTQSSLLEAMNEGQVSADGVLHPLPAPFVVIATQNPLELHGTFPLPESQLDRFLVRLEVGYPDAEQERLLLQQAGSPAPRAEAVLDPQRVVELQRQAMAVTLHPDIEQYVLALLQATRESPELLLGASPRAGQALVRAAKARAFLEGRSFVVPDDVLELSEPVLAHRLVPAYSAEAVASGGLRSAEVLAAILDSVPVPR